jgi:hypothetical protein
MTEYDYSDGAAERHYERMREIEEWAAKQPPTYENPFVQSKDRIQESNFYHGGRPMPESHLPHPSPHPLKLANLGAMMGTNTPPLDRDRSFDSGSDAGSVCSSCDSRPITPDRERGPYRYRSPPPPHLAGPPLRHGAPPATRPRHERHPHSFPLHPPPPYHHMPSRPPPPFHSPQPYHSITYFHKGYPPGHMHPPPPPPPSPSPMARTRSPPMYGMDGRPVFVPLHPPAHPHPHPHSRDEKYYTVPPEVRIVVSTPPVSNHFRLNFLPRPCLTG